MTEKEIIEGCRAGDAGAQRELYERYKSVMFGICRRYIFNTQEAQDVFHDAFITVFTKISEFRNEGSFEGWCRRIFVNTALSYLRKKDPLRESDDLKNISFEDRSFPDTLEIMSVKELMSLISHLPDGYRTILNLYAVDGYSHKEIGEMLGISENTSRSQYMRARMRLISEMQKMNISYK